MKSAQIAFEVDNGHGAPRELHVDENDIDAACLELVNPFLQSRGIVFDRRVNHGMTHSLYIHDPNGYGVELLYDLPREIWEGDIDAALNWAEQLPTEGPEALVDRTDGLPVFR